MWTTNSAAWKRPPISDLDGVQASIPHFRELSLADLGDELGQRNDPGSRRSCCAS